MELGGDTKAVLLSAAVMFLWALLLGVMKYRQILASPEGQAHPYTDIAHRAALLYSFALLLVATFVELSGWGALVNLLAAGAMSVFFFAAVVGYNLSRSGGVTPTTRCATRAAISAPTWSR